MSEIRDAMSRIITYTAGSTYQDFVADSMLRDAVIRNFAIMGECVKHIPFSFQKKYRNVPWQRMLALRNFIVHEFFDVDDEILWEIIQSDLEKNARDIEQLIDHA